MKIAVIGCGLMAKPCIFYLLKNIELKQLYVIDNNAGQLDKIHKHCLFAPYKEKLVLLKSNISNDEALKASIKNCDVIITAVPWKATIEAIHLALYLHKPLISITRPNYQELEILREKIENSGTTIMLGCGLEPGLTEIFTRHIIDKFSALDELHIQCGGILKNPQPPLFYKSTFTSNTLPIEPRQAYYIENGLLKSTDRFSGIELINIENVGMVEAWHDGMLPWLIELPLLKQIKICTQKTLRWPGFAKKIQLFNKLGLLNKKSIIVDGKSIVPINTINSFLKPYTNFTADDRDMVLLRLCAAGLYKNEKITSLLSITGEYDEKTGFTAMGKLTGYTAAICATLLSYDSLKSYGLLRPENYFTGNKITLLLNELIKEGVNYNYA